MCTCDRNNDECAPLLPSRISLQRTYAQLESEVLGLGFGGSLLHLLRLGSVSCLYIVQVSVLEFLSAFVVLCRWRRRLITSTYDISGGFISFSLRCRARPTVFCRFPRAPDQLLLMQRRILLRPVHTHLRISKVARGRARLTRLGSFGNTDLSLIRGF